jgi:hypothetical protein
MAMVKARRLWTRAQVLALAARNRVVRATQQSPARHELTGRRPGSQVAAVHLVWVMPAPPQAVKVASSRPTTRPALEDSMRAPIPARLLLLAMACLVVAACGGSGDDTSGTAAATTTTAASGTTAAASPACADAAALKASMAELDGLDPPEAGKAGIQAALEKVSTNLAALKTSAKSQWSSQITELDGALEAVKTTIAGISGDSLASALPTVLSDLQRLDTAWTALQQQVDQDCG